MACDATPTAAWESKFTLQTRNVSLGSLPADVLWSSFVTHSFLTHAPWGRNECVTNEPQRTSAGRLCYGSILVSNHFVFPFWVVAYYGRFDCTEYFSSKDGGWVEGGSRQAAIIAVIWKQFSTQHLRLLFSQCFVFTFYRWWTNCKDLLSFFSLFLCRPIGELQVTGNFFKWFTALVVNCNECRNNKSSDNGCLPLTWAKRSA